MEDETLALEKTPEFQAYIDQLVKQAEQQPELLVDVDESRKASLERLKKAGIREAV